jgi:endonuclease-3
MGTPALTEFIKDAGLSKQKAPRILAILQRISTDFGSMSLAPLRKLADDEAEQYLLSLPGVGPKTAKCVLMYTLGRSALPVDTHLDRLALRLGLVAAGGPSARRHEDLEALVAPADRYALHVGALAHGRAVCRVRRPRCASCVLMKMCPSRVAPS